MVEALAKINQIRFTRRLSFALTAIPLVAAACEFTGGLVEDNPAKYEVKLAVGESPTARIAAEMKKGEFIKIPFMDTFDMMIGTAGIYYLDQSRRSLGFLWVLTPNNYQPLTEGRNLQALVLTSEGKDLRVSEVKSFKAGAVSKHFPLPADLNRREVIRFYLRASTSTADLTILAKEGLSIYIQEVDLKTPTAYSARRYIVSERK